MIKLKPEQELLLNELLRKEYRKIRTELDNNINVVSDVPASTLYKRLEFCESILDKIPKKITK